MATLSSTTNVSSLVINKVDTKITFQNMLTNNQVNENELYFIPSELGGNSEVFCIEFIVDQENNNSISCNKTYNETIEALHNGYPIYASIKILTATATVYNTNLLYFNIATLGNGPYPDSEWLHFVSPIQKGSINDPQYYTEVLFTSDNNISINDYTINSNTSNATLTIGSYTYDGSSAVNIPVYDGTYTWG